MDYKERRIHGEEGLPLSMYDQTAQSTRYHMNCHWHPEHEIVYVKSGALELRLGVGDESILMKKGDVVFVQGGVLHSAVPVDCHYVCFVLDPSRMLSSEDACEAVIKRIEKGKMKIEPFVSRRNPEMTALCEELYQILTTREDGFVFFVKGLVLRFFGYLLKFQLYEKNPLLVPAEEKSEGRMKSVLNYIRKNYGKEISLSELAALSNMSPNYFCRYFRKLTGQTPIEYLITYRLESACYALRNTDLTVTDITFACGFNDVSHFIKSFRKAYGMTPKAYRAQTDEA